MGKVFKALAVGALVAVGAAFLLPAIGLGAPFAGLFGISNVYLAAAVGGAITGGLSALLAPQVSLQTIRARTRVSVNSQSEMKWVFGETACSTDLVWAGNHGSRQQYYSYVVAAAGHLITEYGDLYLNDELVTFDAPSAGVEAGNGNFIKPGTSDPMIWRQAVNHLGTEVQNRIPNIDINDDFNEPTIWPDDADGLGMAHFRLRFDREANKWQSGIPTRVTQVVKGGPVYDPRLDSTRGGTGAHRANDQTTWEYTNGGTDIGRNWALIVLRYLLGWEINGTLVIGMGIDPDDIDMDQVIAAANVCEQTVDSEARYFVDGILPVTNDHERIIRELEGAINGKVSIVGGKYYIWAPNNDLTPFSSIGDGDILREVGVSFQPSGPMEQLYNTARGRYMDTSTTSIYQPLPYPEVIEASAVTEDGGTRLLNRDLIFLQSRARAERVARHMVRRSRFGGTWRFAMGPKGLTFQPFTVTTLNIQETNNTNVTVRIIDMSYSISGAVVLECIEEDSSIYNTSDPLGTAITGFDPGAYDITTPISVTNLAAVATSVIGSAGTAVDGLKITWDDPGAWVKRTEVQYRKLTDTDWITVPPETVDLTQAIILGLQPGTTYEVRARHITRFDIIGEWATVVQGVTGTDGTDILSPPDYAGTFVYDDLDTTTLAAGQGRYALLTDRATNTSGTQNNFQNVDAVLINNEDTNGHFRGHFLSSLRVGERITYIISNTRWYLYTVDEVMTPVGSGSAQAFKYGVTLAFAYDNDPTVTQPDTAGNNINFEFQRFEPTDVGTINDDPDFDLSTSLGSTSNKEPYWYQRESLTNIGIGTVGGITFVAGGGADGVSNAVTVAQSDGTIPLPGSLTTERYELFSSRRFRSNAHAFSFKVKWRNNSMYNWTVQQLQFQARGYPDPNPFSTTPAETLVGSHSEFGQTTGSTWRIDNITVDFIQNPSNTGRFWEFGLYTDNDYFAASRPDPAVIEIDSIFVYASDGAFVGEVSGLTPKANPGDFSGVLKADGTWSDKAGQASTSFEWDSGTTAADPGVGEMRGNNGTIASITALYVNDADNSGQNMNTVLGYLTADDFIYVQDSEDATKSAVFKVSGAPTDNTGWWTIPVTVHASNGSFTVLNRYTFDIGWNDGGTGGGGGDLPTPTVLYSTLRSDGSSSWLEEDRIQITPAGQIDILDATLVDKTRLFHDGTDLNVEPTNTTNFWLRDGLALRISDTTDADYGTFSHDGTDFNTAFTGTTDWNLTGLTRLKADAVLMLQEIASAPTDATGYGQFWVRNDGEPMFTGDDGIDRTLLDAGGSLPASTEFYTLRGNNSGGWIENQRIQMDGTGQLLIKDSTNADDMRIVHDGTDVDVRFTGTAALNIVEEPLRVVNSTEADWMEFYHNGSHGFITTGGVGGGDIYMEAAGGDLNLRAGTDLIIWNAGNVDSAEFSHDGTDFNLAFTGTSEWNITGFQAINMETGDELKWGGGGGTTQGVLTASDLLMDVRGSVEEFRIAGDTLSSVDLQMGTIGDPDGVLYISQASILHNGVNIWTAQNDGPGSGLDADSVDGIPGSNLMTFAGAQVPDLDELNDVQAYISLATDDIMVYNGTNWQNQDYGQLVSQAIAEAGVDTQRRMWSALRVKQAIDALAPGSSGAQISGTPANNQIAVWTNATTIEGGSDLTFDGNTLSATSAVAGTAAAVFTNAGTANRIASFIGDSDALDIETAGSTGDYKLRNRQQDNSIVFYDGSAGVEIYYNGQLKLECDSSNNVKLHAGATSVLEFQTKDSDATDNLTGADVRHHDGSLYSVGLGVMPIVLLSANTTINDTHWHKALIQDAASSINITFNSLTTQENYVVLWVLARDAGCVLVDGTMTLHLFDGDGAIPSTGNITVARGGWATVYKFNDTNAYVTGVGLS